VPAIDWNLLNKREEISSAGSTHPYLF